MAALVYRRQVIEAVIARSGEDMVLTIDGKERWRTSARSMDAWPQGLPPAVRLEEVSDAEGGDAELIIQGAIEVREPRWTGLDWELIFEKAHHPLVLLRRSYVRPRALDAPLTLPVHLLRIEESPSARDFLAEVFGNRDASQVAVGDRCALQDAEEAVARLRWPRVDVLHFHDLGKLDAEILLRAGASSPPGSIGWIGRYAALWRTRLILIEAHEAQRTHLLRAAHAIVERGGPAIWIVPPDVPWLADLYEWLFHDRPLDWIQRELQSLPDRPHLFVGASREDALRLSAIGATLREPRTRIEVEKRLAVAPARTRRVPISILTESLLRTAVQEQGIVAIGKPLPDHLRIEGPRFSAELRRKLAALGIAAPAEAAILRGAGQHSLAALRARLTALLKYHELQSRRTLPYAAALTPDMATIHLPARPASSMRHEVMNEFHALDALVPKLQFEDHESQGVLPMARALTRLRSRAKLRPVQRTTRPERHVNSGFFSAAADGTLVDRPPQGAPLSMGELVHFGVQIGARGAFGRTVGPSALIEDAFRWTEASKGVGLEIAVTPLDFELLGSPVQELWLPSSDQSARIAFAIRVPHRSAIEGVARLRFSLFFENNLLQSFRVAALLAGHSGSGAPLLAAALGRPASELGAVSYAAAAEYSSGVHLNSLGSVRRRDLSIVANDMAGQKVASLKADDFFAVTVDENLGPKVENVRLALKQAANVAGLYRYQPDNAGNLAELQDLLYEMAEAGWNLYGTLLPDRADREALDRLLEGQKVVHAAHVDLTKVVPWSLVYDRAIDARKQVHYENPSDPDAKQYKVKRALCTATLPKADGTMDLPTCGVDDRCPLSAAHNERLKERGEICVRESVVCPARFWGFRHNIELPVQQGSEKKIPPLRTTIKSSNPAEVLAAFNRHLHGAANHEQNLRAAVAAATRAAIVRDPIFYERDRLKQALEHIQADILYFYCHAEGESIRQDGKKIAPRLNLGQIETSSDTLTAVDLDGAQWRNSPLVFLNGCATAGFSPTAPSEFIVRFVQGRKAAAVIGTEVSTWELLADAMATAFLQAFLSGSSAGEALLQARRRLLAKYNPLGLAYTLFGSADLHLSS